jgi:hypothetical protein
MNGTEPILAVAFFRTASGNEPVREWLRSLPREERRIIGEDIKTVQFGCPLECHWFANSTSAFGKSAPACLTTSRGSSSQPARAAWFFFTALSKNRRKRRKKTYN